MDLLPDEPARSHLLDELASLILAAGHETFLARPLVEPSDRFFPDPWTPDGAGIEHLLFRLLGYAGLEHLELTLELDRYSDAVGEVGIDGRAGHRGTAAWFAGIRAGVCSFGVDVNQLHDPAGLVGTLAHEVAHAYRRAHELEHNESAIEEPLTDLTTIYLGFGVLSVNATQRFRSGSAGAGRTFWSASARGYLPMQAMAYLLAAQVIARGVDIAPVARSLQPNQRACFKAACKQLGDRASLLERLGLPAASLSASKAPEPRRGGWLRRWFRS